ncbi:MAG: RHS repeat domain-containing protein, partial [Akkermansiaceae bacterium]
NKNKLTKSWKVNVTGTARTPAYDLNGNTLTDGTGKSYVWDAENRLTKIIYADNSSTEFQYNGLSQRVRVIEKSAANATISDKRYLWAGGNQPTEERDSSGTTVLKRYFQQGEQIPAAAAPLDKLFYTKDHLGNIRELTDSNGTLRTRYDYDMWGKRVKLSGTLETEVGYTGHHHHAKSGLILTWFRAYDADLGRWLSPEPLGEEGGMNLYGYVENDPLNGVDPYGLWVWHVVGAAAGFGLDLGAQLAMNGGNLSNVNWGSTLISAGTGALGVGLGANVAKITGSIAARATLNALGSAAIGAAGQVANNAMDDCKSWDDGLGKAALTNGVLGGIGSGVGDKISRFANGAAADAAWASASLAQKQLVVSGNFTRAGEGGSSIGTGIGNILGIGVSNSGPLMNIPDSSSSGDSGCNK